MVIRPLSPLSSGRSIVGLTPLLDLHRSVNRLFEGAFRDVDDRGGAASALSPALDVWETPSDIHLALDVPGLSQDDVELRIEGDVLSVSGERKAPDRQEGETWHIAERPTGRFERVIKLPFTPDPDRVNAAFKDGVLSVTVSKMAVQEKGRRIRIGSPSTAAQDTPALTEETAKAKSDEAISRASRKSDMASAA